MIMTAGLARSNAGFSTKSTVERPSFDHQEQDQMTRCADQTSQPAANPQETRKDQETLTRCFSTSTRILRVCGFDFHPEEETPSEYRGSRN